MKLTLDRIETVLQDQELLDIFPVPFCFVLKEKAITNLYRTKHDTVWYTAYALDN